MEYKKYWELLPAVCMETFLLFCLFLIKQIFCLQKFGMGVLVPEHEGCTLSIVVLTSGKLKCMLRGSL